MVLFLSSASDSQPGEDGVPIAALISGVWRRRWLIAAITLLGGVLAYASVALQPTTYESKAILLVQAPQFSSELTPAPLSVATYQALLNSDYTAAKVREILVKTGDIPEGTSVAQVRAMVTTNIPLIPDFRGANPQLPMIEIIARTRRPEIAERVANTFAQVFVQESLEVATQGRAGAIQLIESQYPVSKKVLQDTAVELKERQDQYASTLLQVMSTWNKRIHDFNKETQGLIDKHERETTKLVLAFENTYKPGLTEAKLGRQKSRLNGLESELENNRLSLKGARDVLTELERQIKSEPRYLVVSKAITNGALWNRIGEDSAGRLPDELKDLALREEVPNSIHERIMGSLIDTQVKVETLKPKQEDLAAEIDRVKREIEDLGSEITRVKLEQFNLGRERALELSSLKEARDRELADQQALRQYQVSVFSRERDLDLDSLTLDKSTASSTFEFVSEKFESVRLAKSGQEPYVKIGAHSLQPEFPVARGLMTRIALGLVAAFSLALFGATTAEAVSGFSPGQRNRLNAKTHLDERLAQELGEG